MSRLRWEILTGEYPPEPGGVSDYTFILAGKLAAAGDGVRVWAPRIDAPRSAIDGVEIGELPDHFGPLGLRHLQRAFKRGSEPFRLLVQYVPHMYGFKGMNIPFAAWLKHAHPAPWIMFHEVAFPIEHGQPLKHRVLGFAQQLMARWAAQGMARGFISTQAWQAYLRRIWPDVPEMEWLPVPSNIPTTADAARAAWLRAQFAPAPGQKLIAHFGTYGRPLLDALRGTFARVLRVDERFCILLLGRGSVEFATALKTENMAMANRIHAAGALTPDEVAAHLSAADVLFQPFPDGISTRRSSAMAGLGLGMPLVTHAGSATECVWLDERLVAMAALNDDESAAEELRRLAEKASESGVLAARAKAGYERHFSWDQTVKKLRA